MGLCFSSNLLLNKHVHFIDVNKDYVLFFKDKKWRTGVVRESVKRKHLVIYKNDESKWCSTYLLKKNVTYIGSGTWNYYKNAVCCDERQESSAISPYLSEEERRRCED